MSKINYIDGDIIELAETNTFDVIVHGVNCFCTQKAGLAPQMVKAFKTDTFKFEGIKGKGVIGKLGNIDFEKRYLEDGKWVKYPDEGGKWVKKEITVVNAYTQYHYGPKHIDETNKPLNYCAFTLCMQKINHTFTSKHILLPKIGAGLAGGDWIILLEIIKKELKDCRVTIVNYKK